jgi:hypothetical protein
MTYTVHECFNGERKRAANTFSSRAKAVKWLKEWAILAKHHYWELVNDEDGSLVWFDLVDRRTVKPMGWGFKPNWEDKPGLKATNKTFYVPKVEFRRV